MVELLKERNAFPSERAYELFLQFLRKGAFYAWDKERRQIVKDLQNLEIVKTFIDKLERTYIQGYETGNRLFFSS